MNDKVCIRSHLLSYFRLNDEQLVPDSVPVPNSFESLCCSICLENKSLDRGCVYFHCILKAATASVYDVDSDVEGDVCRHPGCSEGPGRLPRAPVDEDETLAQRSAQELFYVTNLKESESKVDYEDGDVCDGDNDDD